MLPCHRIHVENNTKNNEYKLKKYEINVNNNIFFAQRYYKLGEMAYDSMME